MATDSASHTRVSVRTPAPEQVDLESRPRFAVGSDFLEHSWLSHTASDMLRELVQNEYDAGGSRLDAVFGNQELRVTGNGNPIDNAGWRRLSVMFSTGRIAGASDGPEEVEAKVNGIGSKNAGLRTLFLVGDRIQFARTADLPFLTSARGHFRIPKDTRRVGVRRAWRS